MVVSFAPGGPTDVVARLLGEKFQAAWGQPVVVDNRIGAGGTIGSALVAKAAPDGYTINLAASSHVYNSALFSNLPYDSIKDFTPIARVSYYPLMLITHPSLPVGSVGELVGYAKANPGKIAFGSAGGGTGSHLTAELFNRAAGIDTLIVHYKSAGAATNDLLGGRLQAMFDNPVSALPHVSSNKVRAIATTGPTPSPNLKLPTVAAAGYPNFESGVWFAFIAPAGLPASIVSRFSNETSTALEMPDIRKALAGLGLEPAYSNSEQLAASMRYDLDKYSKLIREAGIKMN
jgi:tripartite-type tricarboxylate transporter receptor subunit TctC